MSRGGSVPPNFSFPGVEYGIIFVKVVEADAHHKALWERPRCGCTGGSWVRAERQLRVRREAVEWQLEVRL